MGIYQWNMRGYYNFYFKYFLENGHICVQKGTKLLIWKANFFFNPFDYINMAIYFCSLFLKEWKYIKGIWEVILIFISTNF